MMGYPQQQVGTTQALPAAINSTAKARRPLARQPRVSDAALNRILVCFLENCKTVSLASGEVMEPSYSGDQARSATKSPTGRGARRGKVLPRPAWQPAGRIGHDVGMTTARKPRPRLASWAGLRVASKRVHQPRHVVQGPFPVSEARGPDHTPGPSLLVRN